MTENPRNVTSVPIHDTLAGRWSPRSFDPEYVVAEDDLTALGEAARWAPSASNTQPARFIVGARGSATFDTVLGTLKDFNLAWSPRASLLIVAVAETARDGQPLRWAEYDLGQAVAHLSVEAESRGLNVRQMGGFDPAAVRQAFDLPASMEPVAVVAVGKYLEADDLPQGIRERDAAPRTRRALEELALVLDA